MSKPQNCKAADMLRFLFSFCDTKGDATEVEPKEDELNNAFKMVRDLANEPNTLLRENLNLVYVASTAIVSGAT